ncbi:MAG: MFS transporter [Natronospirillum sp.]|uniref:MFS transporter n=1 Tax=Natronospirillum sp. TaxID=2812955 RepID=UPI0025FE3762|nr:MFS transporter [Natronospirillum sp.]MCH8550677.1 MFS transporter [Natronospirillum sp.]
MAVTTRRIPPDIIVIVAGISAALHIGKLPPAIPVLEQAMSLDLVTGGFLLSMVMLAGVTLGIVMGTTADSVGLRRALLTGLVLLGAGSLLGALASQPSHLLWLRAVEGLGFLLVVLPAPGLVRRLVPAELLSRRLALWSCYMGLGVGSALLVGPLWLDAFGWQSWWLLLGALSLLLAWAVWQRVPRSADNAPATGLPEQTWGTRIQRTLTRPGPWLVAITFALYSGQWIAVVGFLPTLYTEAGYGPGLIGVMTAMVALVNIAGNLVAGQCLHRGVNAQTLLAAGFVALGLCAWVGFGLLTPGWGQFLAVLLFSACGGLIPGALFYLAVRLAADEQSISSTVGWMQQWSSIGQFIGPPMVALVASQVGGWHWTWGVTGAMTLGGLLATALLARHRARLLAEQAVRRSPTS